MKSQHQRRGRDGECCVIQGSLKPRHELRRISGIVLSVLVGCTSASNDEAGAPVLTPEVLALDPERAPAAVLRAEDLPPEWTAEAGSDSDDPRPDLDSCDRTLAAIATGRTASADSGAFSQERAQVSNAAVFYESGAAAETALRGQLDDRARVCAQEAIEAAVEEGARQSAEVPRDFEASVAIGDLSVEPVGDDRGGWSAQVTLLAGPVTLPAYADVVLVRIDRVVLEFSFLSFLTVFEGPRGEILEKGRCAGPVGAGEVM